MQGLPCEGAGRRGEQGGEMTWYEKLYWLVLILGFIVFAGHKTYQANKAVKEGKTNVRLW